MHRFFAEYISPRALFLHYSDPTINILRLDEINNERINFNTEIDSEIIEKLRSITLGENVDIDFSESQKLRILSLLFGNQEIFDKINEIFPILLEETNIDDCIQHLHFTFTPNRTKYPDGINKEYRNDFANVSGKSIFEQPASAAAFGATVGVSFISIGISVVLILLYLRQKAKMLKKRTPDFSDSFFHSGSSSDSTSSYSYSYYEYEYVYEYISECDSGYENDYYSYYEYE